MFACNIIIEHCSGDTPFCKQREDSTVNSWELVVTAVLTHIQLLVDEGDPSPTVEQRKVVRDAFATVPDVHLVCIGLEMDRMQIDKRLR